MKDKEALTGRQCEVLLFISDFICSNGYAPSRLEIAAEFLMSPNAVQCHLKLMEKKGAVKLIPKISRGIILQ